MMDKTLTTKLSKDYLHGLPIWTTLKWTKPLKFTKGNGMNQVPFRVIRLVKLTLNVIHSVSIS